MYPRYRPAIRSFPVGLRSTAPGSQAVRLVDHDAAAGAADLKRYFDQMVESFADPGVILRLGKDQHKSAAPGSQEFAAERPGALRGGIHFVDCAGGHAIRQFLLEPPRFVEQSADFRNRARGILQRSEERRVG